MNWIWGWTVIFWWQNCKIYVKVTNVIFLIVWIKLYYITDADSFQQPVIFSAFHRIHLQVKVVDGTFNFTEPLEDWISYTEYDNADRPVLRHRLEDLEPDCYYQLEIRARNSMGKSDANALFIFRTASGQLVTCSSHSLCAVFAQIKMLCPKTKTWNKLSKLVFRGNCYPVAVGAFTYLSAVISVGGGIAPWVFLSCELVKASWWMQLELK